MSKEKLKSNFKLRARNLFLYWHNMLGYPSQYIAEQLVDNFAGNRKLNFGQYKGNGIGHIIFTDKQYISWALKNVPNFKLTEMEQILFDVDQKYSVGGSITEFDRSGGVDSHYYDGDVYDSKLIDLEMAWYDQEHNISQK